MVTNQALCVILKATEAGEYIARHLPAISNILADNGDIDLNFGQNINGECHVLLPPHYTERKAQHIIDRLNNLRDSKDRPVLDVELSYESQKFKEKEYHRPTLPA